MLVQDFQYTQKCGNMQISPDPLLHLDFYLRFSNTYIESWVVGFFLLKVVLNLMAWPRWRLPAQGHEESQSQGSPEILHH